MMKQKGKNDSWIEILNYLIDTSISWINSSIDDEITNRCYTRRAIIDY